MRNNSRTGRSVPFGRRLVTVISFCLLGIMVDQEGGAIKRIPWAPPNLSPPEMGKIGLAVTARSQGLKTATALKALGIDVDLAPVADVPASTTSILYRQGRTWSFSARRTA